MKLRLTKQEVRFIMNQVNKTEIVTLQQNYKMIYGLSEKLKKQYYKQIKRKK